MEEVGMNFWLTSWMFPELLPSKNFLHKSTNSKVLDLTRDLSSCDSFACSMWSIILDVCLTNRNPTQLIQLQLMLHNLLAERLSLPLLMLIFTLLETNSSPLKTGHPKRKQSYSNHPFSGANLLLVSGRVIIWWSCKYQHVPREIWKTTTHPFNLVLFFGVVAFLVPVPWATHKKKHTDFRTKMWVLVGRNDEPFGPLLVAEAFRQNFPRFFFCAGKLMAEIRLTSG